MEIITTLFAFFFRNGKRIATLAIGHSVNFLLVYAFDFLLYPFMIWKYGPVYGWGIMVILSFTNCYGTLLFYDWSKRDWLGIEWLRGLKSRRGLLARLLQKGDWIALIVLSVRYDPFIALAYLRKEAWSGLRGRNARIFFTSFLISNLFWGLSMWGGVSLLKSVITHYF